MPLAPRTQEAQVLAVPTEQIQVVLYDHKTLMFDEGASKNVEKVWDCYYLGRRLVHRCYSGIYNYNTDTITHSAMSSRDPLLMLLKIGG
jgi:hypothetical protein